jgi:hypothetical protein
MLTTRLRSSRTFREKSNSEEILSILSEIADNLQQDLERTGYSGRTVVIKYKVSWLHRCRKRRADATFWKAT